MEKRHLQGPAWFPEPPTLRGHRSRRRHGDDVTLRRTLRLCSPEETVCWPSENVTKGMCTNVLDTIHGYVALDTSLLSAPPPLCISSTNSLCISGTTEPKHTSVVTEWVRSFLQQLFFSGLVPNDCVIRKALCTRQCYQKAHPAQTWRCVRTYDSCELIPRDVWSQ